MKSTSTLLSLLPIVANAAFFPREQYESGAVHQIVIDAKNVRFQPCISEQPAIPSTDQM
jgi:hypothetical protein